MLGLTAYMVARRCFKLGGVFQVTAPPAVRPGNIGKQQRRVKVVSVELTPSGTRGPQMPAGPIAGIFHQLSLLAHRLGLTKRMDGFPVILLTTRGARSGQLRSTPVLAFPQGGDTWLVVGSAGGARKHPAWVVNLAHHPRDVWVEVDGRKLKVMATSLRDSERDDAWKRIVEQSGRFAGYQKRTDRQLPVIRLSPAD